MVKNLPKTPCTLMKIEGKFEWAPAGGDDNVFKFNVEYSKSSMATCGYCSDKIKKGEIRVGRPLKFRSNTNPHNIISAWHHLACLRVEHVYPGQQCSGDEVFGIDKLKEGDREKVEEELKKKGLPTHLESIDPNDPDFLKSTVLERVPAPKGISMQLLPYQEEVSVI